jgi:hypothetical protein
VSLYSSTESSGSSVSAKSEQLVTQSVDLSGGRVSGYATRYVKSGAENDGREVDGKLLPSNGVRQAQAKSELVHSLTALRSGTRLAAAAAERLCSAVSNEDFMEATNAGIELENGLSAAWANRNSRESEFQEVLNVLQIAVRNCDYESLSQQACLAIAAVVNDHLRSGLVEAGQVREARKLLKEGGFNAWRGLSLRRDYT